MNQHLDTMPIWEAISQDSECFLCALSRKTDDQYVQAMMGAAVMDSDYRVKVNALGFCARHFDRMFRMKNSLGLALMTHTRLKQLMQELAGDYARALEAATEESQRPVLVQAATRKRMPSKHRQNLQSLAEVTKARVTRCLICDQFNHAMRRYYQTVIEMWRAEQDFRKKFATCKGACVPHYAVLLGCAQERLVGKDLIGFLETLTALQAKNFARLEQELEWFTLKFDYRNADKPWGDSQDALPRAIEKIMGPVLREESEPKI